jgi:hypothetical protein
MGVTLESVFTFKEFGGHPSSKVHPNPYRCIGQILDKVEEDFT